MSNAPNSNHSFVTGPLLIASIFFFFKFVRSKDKNKNQITEQDKDKDKDTKTETKYENANHNQNNNNNNNDNDNDDHHHDIAHDRDVDEKRNLPVSPHSPFHSHLPASASESDSAFESSSCSSTSFSSVPTSSNDFYEKGHRSLMSRQYRDAIIYFTNAIDKAKREGELIPRETMDLWRYLLGVAHLLNSEDKERDTNSDTDGIQSAMESAHSDYSYGHFLVALYYERRKEWELAKERYIASAHSKNCPIMGNYKDFALQRIQTIENTMTKKREKERERDMNSDWKQRINRETHNEYPSPLPSSSPSHDSSSSASLFSPSLSSSPSSSSPPPLPHIEIRMNDVFDMIQRSGIFTNADNNKENGNENRNTEDGNDDEDSPSPDSSQILERSIHLSSSSSPSFLSDSTVHVTHSDFDKYHEKEKDKEK